MKYCVFRIEVEHNLAYDQPKRNMTNQFAVDLIADKYRHDDSADNLFLMNVTKLMKQLYYPFKSVKLFHPKWHSARFS